MSDYITEVESIDFNIEPAPIVYTISYENIVVVL